MNKGHILNDGSEVWADMLMVSKTLDTIIGRTNLLKVLREERYLMEGNIPYQKHVRKGLFKMAYCPSFNSNGKITHWYFITLVPLKGIDLINTLVANAEFRFDNLEWDDLVFK